MTVYHAPLRDYRFVLNELHRVDRLSALPGFEEATPEIVDAVLEAAAKFCETALFPLNLPGDGEGCRYEDGAVSTPAGYRDAYRAFVEAGWGAISAKAEWGGQGLPKTLKFVIEELICSSCLAFSLYPGLTFGACMAIEAHASEALKRRYLAKLTSGVWSGTMCLTEPQAGSDLGLIRSRAEPAGDGSYRISGTKIFITGGEHDLTENIVHLVLAKLPDAPPGSKGISMFLVPKFTLDADGAPGRRNAVACGSIERKMGLKGSATCVLHFAEAEGYLVGAPHEGLRGMFTMMNAERLIVGIQGLGIAETAYQSAVAYARERRQGRSLDPAGQDLARPADPIIVHPDIRRMLLQMRAMNEGCRALAVWVGMSIDIAAGHPDAAKRQAADDLVQLMTPVVKAMFSDHGSEAANLAVQIYGGHGYIHDHGVEQLVRDARIAQLYEGTNGIQAMDLIGRKLSLGGGRLFAGFVALVAQFLVDHDGDARLAEFTGPLARALDRLRRTTDAILERGRAEPEELGAAATDYLKMLGLVTLAYLWARMADAAFKQAAGVQAAGAQAEAADAQFYAAKIATARFFFARLLPQHAALATSIAAGAAPLMAASAWRA